jgi:menaquinone-dependent protoporphyrinogen oxidase
MARILVLFGTSEGHTAKVAQVINDTLHSLGLDTDVIRAGTFDLSPRQYDGVIVAASVHGGHYQRPVAVWVRNHAGELSAMPSAFVSVCLSVRDKDPRIAAEAGALAQRFLDAAAWRPDTIKIVAGALLYTRYNFLMRWIMKRIVAKAGGDTDTSRDYVYTDWDDLRAFAGEFARRVSAAA